MDVTSLYTNIPQEEGITTVCKAYEAFHNNKPPIPSHYLKEMLKLICSVCEVHFVIANMKYLGAQSGMGFLIIKAWRIQFSCILFVYNNPIPSVSIRRWNTTIGDEDQVLSSTY